LCLKNAHMKAVYAIILASLLMVSCGTPRLVVSEELQSNSDEYVVKGKNGTRIKQRLSFGDFSTAAIKRSWTKGNYGRSGIGYGTAQHEWVNIISTEYINKKQTIRFSLTHDGSISDVYCVSRFNSRNLVIGKNPNSLLNISTDILGIGSSSTSMYYVQIFTGDPDDRPWELVLDNQLAQSKRKSYIGYLGRSREEYYSIVPMSRIEINGKSGNALAGAPGFEFRNSRGEAVAAVSLMEKGMIFLAKTSKEERFLLANACAALLLQDVIGG